MKGRKTYIYIILAVLTASAHFMSGCGGGPGRMYSQVGGDITWSELDPDSIPTAPEAESYYIGYGDVLDVNFLYETQYSKEGIKVRPDGRITYPLAGELFVAGMSPASLDSVLTSSFSEIVLDPRITVIVKEFQPQLVYVLGEVDTPDGYEYVRNMTLTQALAAARGYTDDARRTNVLVIRRLAEDHIIGIEVNVEGILSKSDFSLDVPLKPFDIVFVPKSRIATTEQFIERLGTIIGTPMDLYLKGWQINNAEVMYDYYARSAVR
jgi:polysaccharide export outer membrane protein